MIFDDVTKNDLWKLRDRLIREFEGRNTIWENRRKVRYRQMEDDLRALPLNPRIADTALMVHQTELPNQDCHRRVKRLIAHKPGFEVVLTDSSPASQSLGQKLEDGIKALYRWMSRGRVPFDWKCVQHEQGDGLGILKVDFLPGHGSSLADYDIDTIMEDDEELVDGDDEGNEGRAKRNAARSTYREELDKLGDDVNKEAKAYDRVTDKALRAELPPYRMSAPDPLTVRYWDGGDGIDVVLEHGKKSLNPLLESFRSIGYEIEVAHNRLVLVNDGSEAISGQTAPSTGTLSSDLSQEVDYTEIRTRHQIAILIEHPKLEGKVARSSQKDNSGRGIVIVFSNPFGPFTTGYALVPGDITTESDHANEFQPPILGLLASAQAENVLMTAELSAALEEALTPPYIEVPAEMPVPETDETKAPASKESREIPVIAGKLTRAESPKASVTEVEKRISREQDEYKFQDALVGDATADTSGHRLAIQVAQADIQSVPYQNARADAITELMKGIVYSVRKHGLPIYIPTLPDSIRSGSKVRVSEPAAITPEMADLNFELITTLGAETPVTKYAKWQALSLREQQGTVGYQTVMEQSDIENPEEEIARVFEGKLLKAVMEATLPQLAAMTIARVTAKLEAALGTPGSMVGSSEGVQLPFGMPPETGLAGGGGSNIEARGRVRVPGVGMPVVQATKEGGPPVGEAAEYGRVGR